MQFTDTTEDRCTELQSKNWRRQARWSKRTENDR